MTNWSALVTLRGNILHSLQNEYDMLQQQVYCVFFHTVSLRSRESTDYWYAEYPVGNLQELNQCAFVPEVRLGNPCYEAGIEPMVSYTSELSALSPTANLEKRRCDRYAFPVNIRSTGKGLWLRRLAPVSLIQQNKLFSSWYSPLLMFRIFRMQKYPSDIG